MIDDHRTLPHYPRKSLVLAVRKQLNRYGIRPTGSLPTMLNQICAMRGNGRQLAVMSDAIGRTRGG